MVKYQGVMTIDLVGLQRFAKGNSLSALYSETAKRANDFVGHQDEHQ